MVALGSLQHLAFVGVAAGSPPARARLPENASVHAGLSSARGGACEKRLVLPYKLLACLFVTFVVCASSHSTLLCGCGPATTLAPALCCVGVGGRLCTCCSKVVSGGCARQTTSLHEGFDRCVRPKSNSGSAFADLDLLFVYFTGQKS